MASVSRNVAGSIQHALIYANQAVMARNPALLVRLHVMYAAVIQNALKNATSRAHPAQKKNACPSCEDRN